MRSAIGRTNWSSALAWASSSIREQVRHDRVERGREEGLAGAVDGDEDGDMPDLERCPSTLRTASAACGERAARRPRRSSAGAGRSRSLATPPISRKTIVGTVIAMPTMPIAVGAVAELVDLPRECHEERAVAQQRHAHAGPQQPEVAFAQRRE